jgi:hypothetical protein
VPLDSVIIGLALTTPKLIDRKQAFQDMLQSRKVYDFPLRLLHCLQLWLSIYSWNLAKEEAPPEVRLHPRFIVVP